ncbi:MAG: ABC transporter permease [Longicatena sp.]
MRKFLSLTRVTLKNTMGMISDGSSKKSTTVILMGILGVSLIPLSFVFFAMFKGAFESFALMDQAGTVLALAFHVASFITFFFSIFLIPSVFYFSKDGETLLSLPIKPEAIMGSKFIVCLVYEYAFTFLVLLPAFVAYLTCFPFHILFVFFALIIFILLPMYPLVICSIISMLIMRFVPFFKNRDRFNLIAGILSVAVGLGFSFSMNNISSSTDAQAILTTMMQGNNSLISMFAYLFPGVPFAARAIIQNDILQMLIFIGITIASLAVCLFLGKTLYFKGLIGFSETSSSRKKLSVNDMNKLNKQKNRILTYTMKELKLIVRTPIYLMNCIGSAVIFTLMIFVIPLMGEGSISVSDIPQEFLDMIPDFWPYMIMVGIILGIFVSNLNLISSTSISREGTNLPFMKYIPMPLAQQMHAKALSGIIVSVCTSLAMLIAFYFVFPILPFYFVLLIFLTSVVGIILGNYIGIYIDIFHPKLVWEQEAAAVKQNMAGFISMLGGMAIAVGMGVVLFFIPQEFILYASLGILLLMILFAVLLYRGIGKFAQAAFAKY